MEFYYITDTVWNESGVATVHIDEICGNLQKLGHRVTLYLPSLAKPGSPRTYAVVQVPALRVMTAFWFQINLFFRLRKDIRARKPDVLYSRSSTLLFIPALIAKLCAIPLVLEVNGKLSEEVRFERTLVSALFRYAGIFKRIESFTNRHAAGFIAVKEGIKEYLVQRYAIAPGNIRVIQNGVDIDTFRPLPRSEAREKLGLDPSALYIGYLGSFYRWQGLRHIAEAVRLLSAQNIPVKCLIVGSGAEASYLRSFVAENALERCVEIRGPVEHGLVPLYINSFDVCVSYPDARRGGATSPFKIYEYLACGKCVVSSDISGMREEFGGTLVYAAPESASALAGTLALVLNDAARRNTLGAAARTWIEQGHSWETAAMQTADFCRSVLRSAP